VETVKRAAAEVARYHAGEIVPGSAAAPRLALRVSSNAHDSVGRFSNTPTPPDGGRAGGSSIGLGSPLQHSGGGGGGDGPPSAPSTPRRLVREGGKLLQLMLGGGGGGGATAAGPGSPTPPLSPLLSAGSPVLKPDPSSRVLVRSLSWSDRAAGVGMEKVSVLRLFAQGIAEGAWRRRRWLLVKRGELVPTAVASRSLAGGGLRRNDDKHAAPGPLLLRLNSGDSRALDVTAGPVGIRGGPDVASAPPTPLLTDSTKVQGDGVAADVTGVMSTDSDVAVAADVTGSDVVVAGPGSPGGWP